MINANVVDWRKPNQNAITEMDQRTLPEAIAEAERVIFQRWRVLSRAPNENRQRAAIHNALNDLRALKSNKKKLSNK